MKVTKVRKQLLRRNPKRLSQALRNIVNATMAQKEIEDFWRYGSNGGEKINNVEETTIGRAKIIKKPLRFYQIGNELDKLLSKMWAEQTNVHIQRTGLNKKGGFLRKIIKKFF